MLIHHFVLCIEFKIRLWEGNTNEKSFSGTSSGNVRESSVFIQKLKSNLQSISKIVCIK